jgi:hypothetical protein
MAAAQCHVVTKMSIVQYNEERLPLYLPLISRLHGDTLTMATIGEQQQSYGYEAR